MYTPESFIVHFLTRGPFLEGLDSFSGTESCFMLAVFFEFW